jgi:regulator of protease activity HflC (stomatin/prohibitin superfamily)
LQDIISAHIKPWGIQVLAMEIRNVDLPEEMKRAMAKQAEAEREKRAKIINAEGEYMAAEKLFQAASIISKDPTAVQLRYLQTLMEIAAEKNSTILFPIPIDLLKPFIKRET